MVVSIVGAVFLTCYGTGGAIGLVGAILGHVARKQVRERGEAGAGMALAGIIIGWIATGIGLLVLGIVVVAFIWIGTSATSYSYSSIDAIRMLLAS